MIMYSRVYIISVLVAVLLVLSSCEHDDAGPIEVSYRSLRLVKFTDDRYSENILAERYRNQDLLALPGNGKSWVLEELLVGQSPYTVQLSNGYWIIDWKWSRGLALSESSFILPYKWETLTSWGQKWEMAGSLLPVQENIISSGDVYRRTIDNYFSINKDMDIRLGEGEGFMLYIAEYMQPMEGYTRLVEQTNSSESAKEKYYNAIHVEDSLHAIYVQRLIEIVENGDFDKVYNVYPEK